MNVLPGFAMLTRPQQDIRRRPLGLYSLILSIALFVGVLPVVELPEQAMASEVLTDGGSGDDIIVDVVVSDDGTRFVLGEVRTGRLVLGSFQVEATTGSRAFLARQAPSGQWEWVASTGGAQVLPTSIARHGGRLFIGGTMGRSATFGAIAPPHGGQSQRFRGRGRGD